MFCQENLDVFILVWHAGCGRVGTGMVVPTSSKFISDLFFKKEIVRERRYLQE